MKHRILALLLACAMAFSLAACTPSGDIPESEPINAEVTPTAQGDDGLTDVYINAPEVLIGETVAEASAKVVVMIGGTEGTALTLTSNEDFDPATEFTTSWYYTDGETSEAMSPDDVFTMEIGRTYVLQIYFCTPYVEPDENGQTIDTQFDGCVGYYTTPENMTAGSYAADDNQEYWANRAEVDYRVDPILEPQTVYVCSPEISEGETVAEANADVAVEVQTYNAESMDYEPKKLTRSAEENFDPATEFTTTWTYVDGDNYTQLSDGDVFSTDGEGYYMLSVSFCTPYAEPDENGDTFIISVDTCGSETFAPHQQGGTAIETDRDEELYKMAYRSGRADILYEIVPHEFGDWVTTSQATCTATGKQTRTCTTCDKTETRTLPALGHSYTYTRTVGNHHSAVCSRCGDTFEADCTSKDGYCIYCHGIVIIY